MGELDVRVLQSVPTPVADVLLSRGCRSLGDVLKNPAAVQESLALLHVQETERQAEKLLGSCRREATIADAWSQADSALEMLQRAQKDPPLQLPCQGIGRLLGNALRPGGTLLELCGLPGTGKTQLCLQLCAAAQVTPRATPTALGGGVAEAIYIDAEGSFVPRRYAQVCQAMLAEQGGAGASAVEAALRGLYVCRPYSAAELFATVKQLDSFLASRPRVRILVVDSLAFCFRHEFADNLAQRARVLMEIATTLRRYGSEHKLLVVLTNHMTTRFDRSVEDGAGWLAPALGETWAHQPSTQLRLERVPSAGRQSVGRATLTKSMEQATGQSCLFHIVRAGVRDVEQQELSGNLWRHCSVLDC